MARKPTTKFQAWFPERRKFGGVWYSLYATEDPRSKKSLDEKASVLRRGELFDKYGKQMPQYYTRIVYGELPPADGINPHTGKGYVGIKAYLLYIRKKPESKERKAFRKRIEKSERRMTPFERLLYPTKKATTLREHNLRKKKR